MHSTTEAVEVLGYGPWDADNAQMGEFLRFKSPTSNLVLRYTHRLNGDRPNPGDTVKLLIETYQRADFNLGRHVEKRRIIGCELVAKAKAAA